MSSSDGVAQLLGEGEHDRIQRSVRNNLLSSANPLTARVDVEAAFHPDDPAPPFGVRVLPVLTTSSGVSQILTPKLRCVLTDHKRSRL